MRPARKQSTEERRGEKRRLGSGESNGRIRQMKRKTRKEVEGAEKLGRHSELHSSGQSPLCANQITLSHNTMFGRCNDDTNTPELCGSICLKRLGWIFKVLTSVWQMFLGIRFFGVIKIRI